MRILVEKCPGIWGLEHFSLDVVEKNLLGVAIRRTEINRPGCISKETRHPVV